MTDWHKEKPRDRTVNENSGRGDETRSGEEKARELQYSMKEGKHSHLPLNPFSSLAISNAGKELRHQLGWGLVLRLKQQETAA